jgi:hypothetical protein
LGRVLREVRATTYATPLREGGSLPGLVEADDCGLYVVKFRGAGQGTPALVAEVVVGGLAQRLGIRVPELVVIDVTADIAKHEPDEEVQDLLRASGGRNLGMDFLPGSIGYSGVTWRPPAAEAVAIRWLDSYVANVDRSWRNPNLLVWHRTLWAIDHGAALVFQHSWPDPESWARRRYDTGAEHALEPVVQEAGSGLQGEVSDRLAALVSVDLLAEVLAAVPAEWLLAMPAAATGPDDADWWRERYVSYLAARLAAREHWWPPGSAS